jgi:ketosteroid isomerase-like protein
MSPQEFMEELNNAGKSLDRTLSMIADDALYWFSNGTSHHGKSEIAAAFKFNADTIKDDTYKIGALRWIVKTPTCAVCTYPFHWTGKVGGQPAEGRGRGTSVLEKRGEAWFVVHEHLSKGPV